MVQCIISHMLLPNSETINFILDVSMCKRSSCNWNISQEADGDCDSESTSWVYVVQAAAQQKREGYRAPLLYMQTRYKHIHISYKSGVATVCLREDSISCKVGKAVASMQYKSCILSVSQRAVWNIYF